MNELTCLFSAEAHAAITREHAKRVLFDIVFDTVICAKHGADVTNRIAAAFPKIPRDLAVRVGSELMRIRECASPEEPFTDLMHVYVHDASHLITMAQVR